MLRCAFRWYSIQRPRRGRKKDREYINRFAEQESWTKSRLSNRGLNNAIVTVINQTSGRRRENGIRTNVYFNRAAGTIRRGRRGWSRGREDGRKAELVIYGLVGPRGKFMVSQRLSPLDLFVTRYGPWARVTFQESLRACPRGWHALVTSYTDCAYSACLSDRNRIVM